MTDDLIATYCRLLGEMNRLTDEVSAAVGDLRIEDLDRLLADRETLCREIAESRELLYQSLQKTEQSSVAALLAHPRELEQEVLAKQAACELAVSERLRECRTNLTELRQKKNLRHVYGPSAGNSQSQFLDNRM